MTTAKTPKGAGSEAGARKGRPSPNARRTREKLAGPLALAAALKRSPRGCAYLENGRGVRWSALWDGDTKLPRYTLWLRPGAEATASQVVPAALPLEGLVTALERRHLAVATGWLPLEATLDGASLLSAEEEDEATA